MRDFEAARGGPLAFRIGVDGPPEFGFQGLHLLGDAADADGQRLPLGVGHPARRRFWIGSILDDLLDGIVLMEKLKRVLLAPSQLQAMHDLGTIGNIKPGLGRSVLDTPDGNDVSELRVPLHELQRVLAFDWFAELLLDHRGVGDRFG